jgi:NAD(P)-dependent dehydrogenase (short-subunit alcohol dehydrogenase family)
MRLEGQTVVVTGASRGLGRAIALAMAEEGANLVLAARDAAALNKAAEIIDRLGRAALVVRCDVRDEDDIAALAQRALAEFGQVDTLVNSAGIAVRRPLHEITAAEWDDLFDTLVRGTMLVTRVFLPEMIARRRGNIINLAAPLERIETPGFAAYTAAKYAVTGLTRTLAKELRRYNINVNGLHPGSFADTDMTRAMTGGSPTTGLVDPAIVTPAAIALAAQPGRGLTGDIIDAVAWNTDPGLGAGMG